MQNLVVSLNILHKFYNAAQSPVRYPFSAHAKQPQNSVLQKRKTRSTPERSVVARVYRSQRRLPWPHWRVRRTQSRLERWCWRARSSPVPGGGYAGAFTVITSSFPVGPETHVVA
eukprot:SAG11_NODE_138_length_15111_cov_11.388289_10_plen_115_part_00